LPDEALSSWIARIAARYDLSADAPVRHLLPNEPTSGGIALAMPVRSTTNPSRNWKQLLPRSPGSQGWTSPRIGILAL